MQIIMRYGFPAVTLFCVLAWIAWINLVAHGALKRMTPEQRKQRKEEDRIDSMIW